jgi:hypothetical protein
VIDLFGLLMLLLGYLGSGPADSWNWHVGVGLRYSYGAGENGLTLTLSADPTPIRYRRPPGWMPWREGWTCGVSDGYNVWLDPHPPCTPEGIARHELNHVQQRRALGWFGVRILSWLNLDEPPDGYTPNQMLVPHGDGFSLFRLEVPLLWNHP